MSDKIRHGIDIVPIKERSGRIGRIYAQIQADMMTVPEPFSVQSPYIDILAGSWSIFRESLEAGAVSRGEKEIVAVGISQINECPWCVASHGITLHSTGHRAVVQAVRGESASLSTTQSQLLDWAKSTLKPDATIPLPTTYSESEKAEIIGTAVCFHYLNRVVNATLIESPLPEQSWLANGLQRGLGLVFRLKVNQPFNSGETADFLPSAALPKDMQWANANPAVAGAFARFAAAIETAAEQTIPMAVRELVTTQICKWRGESMGMSRTWVNEAVSNLPENDRPIGKLALLTALASFQVDDRVVAEFRQQRPDDEDLIATIGWASFTAARRIGVWLN